MTGHSCLAFDEARYGIFIRKAEIVRNKSSTWESELEGENGRVNMVREYCQRQAAQRRRR